MNPVLDAGNAKATQMTAGFDVLTDTLLLSRCAFLLKVASMVSEVATYLTPRLINASYDFHIRDQPRPPWAYACRRDPGVR